LAVTQFPPTPRGLQMLRYVAGYQRAHGGVSPSLDECAAGLGLNGKSGASRMLALLEDRGLIRRLPNRARAIELLVDVSIPTAPDDAPLHAVPLAAIGAPSI
jgi:SOS-response transcriptional repressor LexA